LQNALLAQLEFPVKMTLIRAVTVLGLLAMAVPAHASPALDWIWAMLGM
jgi:hypothetical protein